MNARRRLFVHEYLKDLNGKQAAIRAGFAPASAEVTASQLLSNPKVRSAVDMALAARELRVQAKSDDVLRELMRMASVDVGEAFDSKGRLLPLHRMSEDVRRAISSIEVEELYEGRGEERVKIGVLRKVKFWDKKGALELLGKHLRMFAERTPDAPGDETPYDVDTAMKIIRLARSRAKNETPAKH